jgi:hypothetical protein
MWVVIKVGAKTAIIRSPLNRASMGKLKMTDPFFAKVIADISANNTLYFTQSNFFIY